MIFVTGPLYAGKQAYIQAALGLTDLEFTACAVRDVQERAREKDPASLAEELSTYRVVIATEVGGGVVPIDPEERAAREAAGRLACELAKRAESVVRVCCGLPQLLKGDWPC